jgi:HAMP domain-containing protein
MKVHCGSARPSDAPGQRLCRLIGLMLSAACLAFTAQERPAVAASSRLRVAAISFVPAKFELQRNADELERLFRQAAAGGKWG